jgi:hypothetical protein
MVHRGEKVAVRPDEGASLHRSVPLTPALSPASDSSQIGASLAGERETPNSLPS